MVFESDEGILVKTCPKCKETKEVSFFYKNKRQADGYSVWCKIDTTKDTKARAEANPEKTKARSKSYYENNKEAIYERASAWARKNSDKRRLTERKYRESNSDKRLYWESNRRARLLEVEANFPENGKDILFDFYGYDCMNPSCTKELSDRNPLTMDHVIPVTWEGGTHSLDNMQILCLSCNASKGNRSDEDFRNGKICVLV